MADLRSTRFWSAALVGALLVVAIVLSDGTQSTRPTPPARSLAAAADTADLAAVSAPADASADPPTPHAARLSELGRMAESFRNESFLVAIRDAGFICYRFVDARPNDLSGTGIWLITCDDTLSYLVGVDAAGALAVEPAPTMDAPPQTPSTNPISR